MTWHGLWELRNFQPHFLIRALTKPFWNGLKQSVFAGTLQGQVI